MTKRLLTLSVIAAAIFLGGCMMQPEPPVEIEPVVVTIEATVDGTQAIVEGCIEGGTAPYWVWHDCDGSVICGDDPPCTTCPTPCTSQVPCPEPDPIITDCCFEFVCVYEEAGTYTIVVSVMDTGGQHVWTSATVTITAPPPPPPPETYTIVATFGPGGSISPAGNVHVDEDGSVTFTITPFSGYVVGDVLVDGASVGAVTEYTFDNVDADHTIWAGFGLDTPPDPPK